MGVYKLSKEAENDIANIYEYGIEHFGILQAQKYLLEIHDIFQTLADNPDMGRDSSEFVSSLKRFNYKAHMIFYLTSSSGIFIVRTLHHSMDYKSHL